MVDVFLPELPVTTPGKLIPLRHSESLLLSLFFFAFGFLLSELRSTETVATGMPGFLSRSSKRFFLYIDPKGLPLLEYLLYGKDFLPPNITLNNSNNR
jgi:hypothetical protein